MDRNARLHIGLAGLLSVLFVIIQGLTVAHAIQHGDKPHHHDGKECAIAAFQDREDDPALAEAVCIVRPDAASTATVIEGTSLWTASVPGLANPRAPPATR